MAAVVNERDALLTFTLAGRINQKRVRTGDVVGDVETGSPDRQRFGILGAAFVLLLGVAATGGASTLFVYAVEESMVLTSPPPPEPGPPPSPPQPP